MVKISIENCKKLISQAILPEGILRILGKQSVASKAKINNSSERKNIYLEENDV